MNYIESFLKEEVGIDIKNSTEEDVLELSTIIDCKYPNTIQIDEYDSAEDGTVYGYWSEVNDGSWDVLVFETSPCHLNAYRDDSAKNFREKHKVLTAGEILKLYVSNLPNFKDVNEDEFVKLFEV